MNSHSNQPGATSIAFTTSAEMPYLIYQACLATGTRSNTEYIRQTLARALAHDLGIPLADIQAKMPKARTQSAALFPGTRREARDPAMIGPANTIEEVR